MLRKVNPLFFGVAFSLILLPKYSFIDLSIFFSVLLLPLLSYRQEWKLPQRYLNFAFVLLCLIWYQIAVQLVNQVFEFEVLARLARALVTVLLVGLFFGSPTPGNSEKILASVTLVLLLHAVMVIVAALWHPANEFFSALSGNDRVRDYRASGLMAGFDIAGLLCVCGMLILLFRSGLVKSKLVEVLLLALLLLGCYFTSRISTALGIAIFVAYGLRIFRDSEVRFMPRFLILAFIGFLLYQFVYAALLILEVTFPIGLVDVDPATATDLLSRYAAPDPDEIGWFSMIIRPKMDWQIVFGAGYNPVESDVGYIKEVFRYGIVGLTLALLAHASFIYRSIGTVHLFRGDDLGARLVGSFFVLMLFLTLKNNYIFVRGVFPLFLLLVSAVACERGLQPRAPSVRDMGRTRPQFN